MKASEKKKSEKSQQRNERCKEEQVNISESETIITRMKKLSGWAHSVTEEAEERINELGDSTI